MTWIAANAFPALIFIAFIAMHVLGHGGHGGHSGHGAGDHHRRVDAGDTDDTQARVEK